MEPVVDAASKGIDRLFDYGAAMTVLVLVLIATGFLVRYLLSRCDARFKESLDMHKELTERSNDVVEKNTIAITQLSDSIKHMKGGANDN